jgi:hypothetical protein
MQPAPLIEMAWCAAFQLGRFGECREQFRFGVLPRCGVCPLFDAERAIRAGIPEEPAPPLAIGDDTDAPDRDWGGYMLVRASDFVELLSSELPDWLDLRRLFPDSPPPEWVEPEREPPPRMNAN